MVFLASATASNSASIVFTSSIDATYNCYLFVLDDVLPANDGAEFWARTSTDGGSNYDDSSGNYKFSIFDAGGSAQTFIGLTPGSSNADDGISGRFYLFNPSDAHPVSMQWHINYLNTSAAIYSRLGAARREAAADVDAIQFVMSGGNITSGTISMYGMTTPS